MASHFSSAILLSLGLCVYTLPLSAKPQPVAQDPKSLPPQDSKKKDLSHNPFVKAMASAYTTSNPLAAKVKEVYGRHESVPIAKSGFRPNISITSSTGRRWQDVESPAPSQRGSLTTRPANAGLNLSQSLYSGGSTEAQVSGAEVGVEAGWKDFTKTEQEVLLSAIQAYIELWYQRAVFDLRTAQKKVLEKTLEQADARSEVGELTLTDVSQAQSRLAEATANLIAAQQDVIKAEATYRNTIGDEPPANLELPPSADALIDMPQTQAELIKIAEKNNPSLQQAHLIEKAAQYDVKSQEGALLPNITFDANASRNLQSSSPSSRSNSAEAMLTLRIPIFQRGEEWAKLRQVNQSAAQKKVDVRTALKSLIQSADTTWATWVSARDQIQQFLLQIKAAELSLQGARQESLVGERTLLDVLDAEKELVTAQTAHARSQRDYLLAGYTLVSVMGLLNALALRLPVETYNIKGHYNLVRDHWVGLAGAS